MPALPSIFRSFVSIWALLQLPPLPTHTQTLHTQPHTHAHTPQLPLWVKIKAVRNAKAKHTPSSFNDFEVATSLSSVGLKRKIVKSKKERQSSVRLMARNWIKVCPKLTFNYVAPNDILISFSLISRNWLFKGFVWQRHRQPERRIQIGVRSLSW